MQLVCLAESPQECGIDTLPALFLDHPDLNVIIPYPDFLFNIDHGADYTPAKLSECDPPPQGAAFLPHAAYLPGAQPRECLQAEPEGDVPGITESHRDQYLKGFIRDIPKDFFPHRHPGNLEHRDCFKETPPMSVIRGFVAVQLRTGDLHKPAELPYKVRHKSSHGADTFGDAVPSPVVPVRFLFRCIIVKVFLQHLRCNAEHMADPEPPSIVHQDIVEHPADVIQLLLRIR